MYMDQFNELELACRYAANYPTNGIRTHLFRHVLRAYKGRLAKRSSDLFERQPKYPVDFLEAYDGEQFQKWACTSLTELEGHLRMNSKDPRCRHIFIQADTSISPLDCSKDVFLLLLTFHQVMPHFLELVFSFGRQPAPPSDFHYTAFYHEDFLGERDAKDHAIQRLGRSGRQSRQCYNLWSVEESDADGSWTFRQTAVYHSFDIETSRALWINIKANDLMLERITDVETSPGRRAPGIDPDACALFAATLTTHLVIFAWCCENWRDFLASLEHEIRAILTKVKNAPIAEVESALEVDINALLGVPPSSPPSPSRAPTLPKSPVVSRKSTGVGQRRVLSGLTTTSEASQGLPTVPQGPPPENPQPSHPPLTSPDRTRVLKEFSIKSLQRLGGIGSKLQEASLIMKLNVEVIGRIVSHYESLMREDDFPDLLKTGCKSSLALFKNQTHAYIGNLEMERSRIATLTETLEDGKRLFDTVLQFRNMEINKLFAVNAQETAFRMESMTKDMHKSTLKMEKLTDDMGHIAKKTERETASMHIITLVTLVFLPGTFVAVRYGLPLLMRLLTSAQTLFGSGLFQWDQNHPEMPFPLWKQEYFNLFAEICFPLMFGVIVVWCVFYLWTLRREKWKKEKRQQDEEMQRLGADEKSCPKTE